MTALASGEAYGSVDFAAGTEIQVEAVGAADGVGNLGAKQGGLGGTQQAPGGARRWIPSAVVRSVLITGCIVGAFTVYAHGSYWNVAEKVRNRWAFLVHPGTPVRSVPQASKVNSKTIFRHRSSPAVVFFDCVAAADERVNELRVCCRLDEVTCAGARAMCRERVRGRVNGGESVRENVPFGFRVKG